MQTIKPRNAKFVAEIKDVRELRLTGSANLDFWNGQLAGKSFQALADGGCAKITIAATDLVWRGFQFNELTISLAIAARDNPFEQIGYLLLHALNSNRFFAFCERAFFSAPYYFGKVSLQETISCSMHARTNNRSVLKAEMSRATRPVTEETESWEGAIFLPGTRAEKYFIGKLSGTTKVCPFIETDLLQLKPEAKDLGFDLLGNSGFEGKEWRMRSNAFHAKSKTYRI